MLKKYSKRWSINGALMHHGNYNLVHKPYLKRQIKFSQKATKLQFTIIGGFHSG